MKLDFTNQYTSKWSDKRRRWEMIPTPEAKAKARARKTLKACIRVSAGCPVFLAVLGGLQLTNPKCKTFQLTIVSSVFGLITPILGEHYIFIEKDFD